MAASPEATSSGSASVASCRLSKTRKPVEMCGRTGIVRNVTSAMNASVPSLPTTRCARIPTASGKSRKEFNP